MGDIAIPMTRYATRVLAIEPNPRTFTRLRKNVESNQLEHRISCAQVGIAEEGSLRSFVMTTDPGNSEVFDAGGSCGFDGLDTGLELTSIETVRLDDLVAQLQIPLSHIRLVCSDTQGFESQVIASGGSLWRKGACLWVEVWPRGLRCHGGVERFVSLCNQHFTYFLPLDSNTEGLIPVQAIDDLVKGLTEYAFTDILLVHSKPR
ncbi:MAG: FkbM family methyltransferase [Bryobacterales bacterium]|nr:FkbM family methyltransferase [Bryobacterales bacterium]